MKFLYLIFFVLILVIGFVLAILNSAPININYYYGWIEIPLSFALLGSFIIGALMGLASKVWSNWVLRQRYVKLSKQAELTKKEVSNLRMYPAKKLN